MDKKTEDELLELGAYARMNNLPRALAWLMRAMQEARPRRPRGIKVQLLKGGRFWLDPERLRSDDASDVPEGTAAPHSPE